MMQSSQELELPALNAIVLCGGASRRFGSDKTLARIGGETLLARAVGAVGALARRVIVAGRADRASELPRRAEFVCDSIGEGPLAGIYAGLSSSDTDLNIVVGGDMPFLNADLLRYLAGLIGDADVAVPEFHGRLQVLHAVYRRACRDAMLRVLENGGSSPLEFLDRVSVQLIGPQQIATVDSDGLSFFNVNAPPDLQRGIELWRARQIA